jgi:hypothetical protein
LGDECLEVLALLCNEAGIRGDAIDDAEPALISSRLAVSRKNFMAGAPGL